jgi:penicillin-binding protein 1A
LNSWKRSGRRARPLAGFLGWLIAGLPLLAGFAVMCGCLGFGLGTYLHYAADLPTMPDLRAYRPKTVSTFHAEDGTVIGIFYKEKRFPVALDTLPPHVIQAFLAAEDARFFSHTGVDLFGVLRALAKNLKAGTFAQGGSTITQQVTRNFLLSKDKRLSRKIREAILSFRLEKTLSKEEILEIYLNEIYLGKGAYGVEAASRTYFGKHARDLTVSEAAMLAGSVSNPTKYSPSRNVEASLKRREFVLDNMVRYGFIREDQHKESSAEVPKFREEEPSNPYERVPYFTEAVRRYIVDRYGEQRLYNEGLEVWTTCNESLQDKASEALLNGVKAWEKRQGRPAGLIRKLTNAEVKEFVNGRAKEHLRPGDVIRAVVVDARPAKKEKGQRTKSSLHDCTIALPGNARIHLQLESPIPYRVNHLLEFRVVGLDQAAPILEPQTLPPLQGAVVCIENRTGYVRALVGGLDFERSSFNRAVQALRQPGSAFKPFIYAAALEWGNYSPQTLIIDEPIAVLLDPRKHEWVPGNSDGKYLGLMSLKDALAQSRNTVAVKLLMDLGVDQAARMARRMGITSHLDRNLSLSLGTSEVSPLELTAAYTVFPNMGMRIRPVLVKKVKDRFGNVLEDNSVAPLDVEGEVARAVLPISRLQNLASASEDDSRSGEEAVRESDPPSCEPFSAEEQQSPLCAVNPHIDMLISGSPGIEGPLSRPPAERVLTPVSSYLMLSMLRKACVSGTAAAASRLKRKDVAGKTGTTDDCSDAWFVGFNPKYTTGVWMGYDTKVSLGRGEYGGTTALPVWMDLMREALADEPSVGYPVPAGVVFAHHQAFERTRNHADLMEDDPDYFSAADVKPVSPVDFNFMLASAPGTTFLAEAGHSWGYGEGPPAVRVLSPSGQDLGFGYYFRDERGNLSLRRDWGFRPEDATGASAQTPGFSPSVSLQPPPVVEMGPRLLGFSRSQGLRR